MKSLLICSIILCPLALIAQHKQYSLSLAVDGGVALPMDKNFSDVFSAGLNLSAGPIIDFGNRFSIQPAGGMKWYYKEVAEVNRLTENFRIWKAGAAFYYVINHSKRFQISPFIRIDNNWCSNYYSKTYNYNVYNNTGSVAVSDKYLTGNGVSADVGFKMKRDKWYIKVDHEFFKPRLKINRKLREEALSQGLLVAEKQTFNLNSVNLTLGFHLTSFK